MGAVVSIVVAGATVVEIVVVVLVEGAGVVVASANVGGVEASREVRPPLQPTIRDNETMNVQRRFMTVMLQSTAGVCRSA